MYTRDEITKTIYDILEQDFECPKEKLRLMQKLSWSL